MKPVEGFDRALMPRYLLFAGLALAVLVLDLWTKHWVFSWDELQPLGSGNVYWIWPGHAGFQLSLNRGALFGMAQGWVWLFAVVAMLAAIGIPIWLFAFGAARDLLLTCALACIMGGVLGNLYDRLGLPGLVYPPGTPLEGTTIYAVRDWILWQWNDQWRWPNFNIADAGLVIGAGMMVLHAFRPVGNHPPPARRG